MKLGFWERRRVRKTFEEYVSPAVIRLLERNPTGVVPNQEMRHFQFVVVLLDDSQSEDVLEILGRVADGILRHHAMISHVSASIVVACLGVPFREEDSVDGRLSLVKTLVSEKGVVIRIAHGQCNARVGFLGGKTRFIYGAVIPGFNSILKGLLDSPAGTVIEVAAA